MSEPDTRHADNPYVPPPADSGHGLSRRGWTVALSMLLVLAFGIVGGLVNIPYVALGPGPTYDTLGTSDEGQVIKIEGAKTYPTSGELRMTTVSLTDDVSLLNGLRMWVSGTYALAPREDYFKPGETDEDVKKENVKQFKDSQSNAEVAALRKLGYPVKVIANEIVEGSPADSALEVGDQLVEVNGDKIARAEDVRKSLKGTKPGDTIELTVKPDGKAERTVKLDLAKKKDREEGFIGLVPADRADVKFKIDIKLEDVGGPSAGLMFALAIVDQLTPGALANGEKIAGTGEINDNGEVGPIGGIAFKLIASREVGVETFLVPEANCPEAVDAGVEGIRLVKVGTLDDAVDALEKLDAGGPVPSC